MASLLCFTNCYLPTEDGALVLRDLWIDASTGRILDAQKTFFVARTRPATVVDLGGSILSPGFLDIQINGAYGFDFSIYEDDQKYIDGLRKVATRIVETGVTSLLPTIITQQRALYPKLLSLLGPHAYPPSEDGQVAGGATLLGWHAEGPFLQTAKRGAHEPGFLVSAPDRIGTFDAVYGTDNLAPQTAETGVRVITAAPEIEGVMDSIDALAARGVLFSVGHSIATSPLATRAVIHGARLITHLFNAMPQLHHRDPAIIGLLGAGGLYSTCEVGEIPSSSTPAPSRALSPSSSPPSSKTPTSFKSLEKKISSLALSGSALPATGTSTSTSTSSTAVTSGNATPQRQRRDGGAGTAEALDDLLTPPMTPVLPPQTSSATQRASFADRVSGRMDPAKQRKGMPSVAPGDVYARPYYGLIVDGIHSHPNSVRLAYTAHPEGCILVTDAMSFLDPHLPDGPHDWRDGRRVNKKGDKLVIDGTDTLAGSVVTLDTCIRNFTLFTSTPLSKALLCATLHPARCLGIEDKKGTLRPGADADLVVLDWEGRPLQTWVAGRRVWAATA